MAEVVGFEPTHAGVKDPCLTAWLHLYKKMDSAEIHSNFDGARYGVSATPYPSMVFHRSVNEGGLPLWHTAGAEYRYCPGVSCLEGRHPTIERIPHGASSRIRTDTLKAVVFETTASANYAILAYGGPRQIRTDDLLLMRQLFSPLN